ncbi:MAG TPA: hypothetical protein VN688_18725 [Gemmataceae bacterium]|nr:hypothetical protein [Gemmataceae bacterium]
MPAAVPDTPESRGTGDDSAPGEQDEPATARITPPQRTAPEEPRPAGVRILPRETPASEEPDEPVSLFGRLLALNAGSATALLCGSVALLFVSIPELDFLIKPLSALGLLIGLLAGVLPALRKGTKGIIPLIVSVFCLLILLFVGSWPRSSAPPPRPMVAIPLQQGGMVPHQPVTADDWVDAAANAMRRDDVRVQVVSARVGRVDLKKQSGVVPSPDRYLVIRLRVSYEGILFQQTPYEPWADLPDSPSKHQPILTDNSDLAYTQKTFDAGKVVGRADLDALTPGHQVKEVLVFPIPPRDVEYLRLTLPAAAFGLTGEFRFRISRGMLQAP